MTKKHTWYIGIDPDVAKSGVALWNRPEQKFEAIGCMSFWELIRAIEHGGFGVYNYGPGFAHIIIEAGWLNEKSNFHPKQGAKVREKMAKNIGMNHQIGKLLVEFCEMYGISYELKKPLGTKSINQQIFKQLTGWPERTNQDSRDAAMLVFKI